MEAIYDQKLKVEVAAPKHGWTIITLSTSDNFYRFFPSHVPYDSINELTNALLKILDGFPEAIVHWNDEPVEHEFMLMSESELINFKVYEIINSVITGKIRAERFSFCGTLYDVIRPFWKALRDMQSKQSPEEYEKQWREPFPLREMIELTRRVKEIKLNVSGNRC